MINLKKKKIDPGEPKNKARLHSYAKMVNNAPLYSGRLNQFCEIKALF